MVIRNQTYTLASFETFADSAENHERLLELINGEIVEKVPTEAHGQFAGNLFFALKMYVKQKKIGRVTVEVRHRPADEAIPVALIPDVAYTSPERVQALVYEGSVPQMPDLAVEVKSPSDTYTQMREKATLYLKHGAKMVWLVYPEKRLVEIYQQDKDIQILVLSDTIDGADVLPDFSMAVADVFEV